MTCKLPYLDENPVFEPVLTEARQLHFDIGKSLRSEQDIDGDPQFTLTKGYMKLSVDPARQQQQLDAVRKLNDQFAPQGTPLIQIQDVPQVGKVISIDVRPAFLAQLTITGTPVDVNPDNLLFTDQIEAQTQQELTRDMISFAQRDPKHEKLFLSAVSRIRSNLNQYIASIEKGQVATADYSARLAKLRSLAAQLDDANSLGAIESLSNYIVQTAQTVDKLKKLFLEDEGNVRATFNEVRAGIDRNTGNLLTEEERDEKIRWLGIQINKSKHYLYLFDDLDQLQAELKKEGYAPNTDLSLDRGAAFATELTQWFHHPDFQLTSDSLQQINDYLTDPTFTKAGLSQTILYRIAQDNPAMTVKTSIQVQQQLGMLLDKFQTDRVDAVLQQAINNAKELKGYIRDYHHDLLTEWLWPQMEEKQTNLKTMTPLTKDQFKTLFQLGEEDEGFFKLWLDAAIKSHDPVTALAADLISDQLYRAVAQTQQDGLSIQSYWLDHVKPGLGNLSQEQINQYYDGFTHEVNRVDLSNLEEVDEDWLNPDQEGGPKPTITVTVFNQAKTYKAYRKKSLMGRYNTAKYELSQHLFSRELSGRIKELEQLLDLTPTGQVDDTRLNQFLLANLDNPYYKAVRNRLYAFPANQSPFFKQDLYDKDKPWLFWKTVKSSLWSSWFQENTILSPPQQQSQLLERMGVQAANGTLINPGQKPSETFWKNVSKSNRKPEQDMEKLRKTLLTNSEWSNSLITSGNHILIRAYQNGQVDYRWVDLGQAGALDHMDMLFYKSGDFQEPRPELYHIEHGGFGAESQRTWETLKQDTTKWDYYRQLRSLYRQANDQTGGAGLKHYQLPQVQQVNNLKVTEEGFVQNLWNWLKESLVGQTIQGIGRLLTWNLSDKDTNTYLQQYLNGQAVQTIPIRFTRDIEDKDVERDLMRSFMAYKASTNQYAHLRQIEPQVQILRSVLSHDTKLGLEARAFKERDANGKPIKGRIDNFLKKWNPGLNQKLREFIDDAVYGVDSYGGQIGLGDEVLDLNRISNGIMGYTSFMNLAGNVSSMFNNLGVGNLNNLSMGVGGRYYTKQHLLEANKEYGSNLVKFLGDLRQPDPRKKSKITQLMQEFDAIQGEMMDEFGEVSSTGNTNKLLNRALYFTMSGAEHQIQTTAFLAQMMAFKLPSGTSLWEAVSHKPGETIQFSEEVTPEILTQFRKQIHKVSKDLNGQYAKIDKAMVQRRWLGRMAMMFKKYLWSSIRYRYAARHIDFETGEEEEGYMRSYLHQLWEETSQYKGFYRRVVMGGQLLAKANLGVVDQLLAGALSQNSDQLRQYLYGTETDGPNRAARQTVFDLMWLNLFFLLGAGLHGLMDDDEEEKSLVMQNIELWARRMEGDLGMYVPFYVGTSGIEAFSTYDKGRQLVTQPFAQLRTFDASTRVLSQLVGVEYGDEGVNFTFNDQYTRSGQGYEKGDYKLAKYAERSLLGPIWQIMKLFNPEEQLQYLNMVRKNSN